LSVGRSTFARRGDNLVSMHELGIAEAALRVALEEARIAGAARVARIVLRVGAFSGVDAEALRFAFVAILPGTAAEGAALEIEPVAAVACCPDCQCDFSPGEDFLFECPGCGRISTAIKQGRELELTRLEVY
jgi:hydrogenase nickel incorporation protein HypA/HybF